MKKQNKLKQRSIIEEQIEIIKKMSNKQLNKIRALVFQHELGALDSDEVVDKTKDILLEGSNINYDKAKSALSYVG